MQLTNQTQGLHPVGAFRDDAEAGLAFEQTLQPIAKNELQAGAVARCRIDGEPGACDSSTLFDDGRTETKSIEFLCAQAPFEGKSAAVVFDHQRARMVFTVQPHEDVTGATVLSDV